MCCARRSYEDALAIADAVEEDESGAGEIIDLTLPADIEAPEPHDTSVASARVPSTTVEHRSAADADLEAFVGLLGTMFPDLRTAVIRTGACVCLCVRVYVSGSVCVCRCLFVSVSYV